MRIQWLLFIAIVLSACSGSDNDEFEPEDDCTYEFKAGIDAIYGAWEPEVIIDLDTGDSTFYEPGDGPYGFMVGSYLYADSYEFRDNGEFDIYYVELGRPCRDDVAGNWTYQQDSITMTFMFLGDTMFTIPVISLTREELIIEDEINFRKSRAIFRKVN